MYFDYPLEQGLRQEIFEDFIILIFVFWLSIRTRIKTSHHGGRAPARHTYFDYPLEQGLRLFITAASKC